MANRDTTSGVKEFSLRQRVAALKREKEKQAGSAFRRNFRGFRAPISVAKRSKKNHPREISSRRPVPVGREQCLGITTADDSSRSVKYGFDPRFEEHCGELREDHVERNYAFVNGLREKRRSVLHGKAEKGKADEDEIAELRRMDNEDERRKRLLRRRKVLKEFRAQEKEAVKQGKQPYFLKEKDVRKLEMEEKFKELKEIGGVKKYIMKRRKRLASKDRKLLPDRKAPIE